MIFYCNTNAQQTTPTPTTKVRLGHRTLKDWLTDRSQKQCQLVKCSVMTDSDVTWSWQKTDRNIEHFLFIRVPHHGLPTNLPRAGIHSATHVVCCILWNVQSFHFCWKIRPPRNWVGCPWGKVDVLSPYILYVRYTTSTLGGVGGKHAMRAAQRNACITSSCRLGCYFFICRVKLG